MGTSPRSGRFAMAAGGLAVMVLGGWMFLHYFLIWSMGALVARMWPLVARVRIASSGTAAGAFAFAVFFLALIVARLRWLGPVPRGDLALGAATSLLVAVLLAAATRAGPRDPALPAGLRDRYARAGGALADFSYTTYLVHYPPLVFLYVWLIRSTRWTPDPLHLLAASAITVGVLALYAYPVSRLTEAHTDRVRAAIGRGLGWGSERRAGTVAQAPLLR